jgi:hypothetical protein
MDHIGTAVKKKEFPRQNTNYVGIRGCCKLSTFLPSKARVFSTAVKMWSSQFYWDFYGATEICQSTFCV